MHAQTNRRTPIGSTMAALLAMLLISAGSLALSGCGDNDPDGDGGDGGCPTCPIWGEANTVVIGTVSDSMDPPAVVYVVNRQGAVKDAVVTINGQPLTWAGDDEYGDDGYDLEDLPLTAGQTVQLQVIANGEVITMSTVFPGPLHVTAPQDGAVFEDDAEIDVTWEPAVAASGYWVNLFGSYRLFEFDRVPAGVTSHRIDADRTQANDFIEAAVSVYAIRGEGLFLFDLLDAGTAGRPIQMRNGFYAFSSDAVGVSIVGDGAADPAKLSTGLPGSRRSLAVSAPGSSGDAVVRMMDRRWIHGS